MFVKMSLEEAKKRLIENNGSLPNWFSDDYCFITYDGRWKFNSAGMEDFILVGKDKEGKTYIKASR